MHQIALGRGKRRHRGWVGGGYIAGENHEMMIFEQRLRYAPMYAGRLKRAIAAWGELKP